MFARGRVLDDPGARDAARGDPWWRNLARTARRLSSGEVAGARVVVRFAGAASESATDDEGHFRTWLVPAEPPGGALPWHPIGIEASRPGDRGSATTAVGRVLVPDPAARFGVVSDVDDTVLRTNVASLTRMAAEVAFGNAYTRTPFPGVAPFFRALHAGADGPPNPIFYVSNGPWNLYGVVIRFLELQGIPLGPLDLRDWGWPPGRILDPAIKRAHKTRAIHRILETYPSLPFLLIGDSGEEDPEIYRDVVHAFPSRVPAVVIRAVAPSAHRNAEIEALAEEVTAAGSALVLAGDTLAAARHAVERGWIDPAALADVESDRGTGGEAVVVEDGVERRSRG